ncbi:hypothetical protein BSKO_03340 [Bryopsis sp. KO-2023]|nr:hypothetical protein BSKO_03340 [Bryopsis sp. KO-2023]
MASIPAVFEEKMPDVETPETQSTASASLPSSNQTTQSSNPVPLEVPLRSQTVSREAAEKAVIELSVTVHPNSPLASFRRRAEVPKFPGSYMAWYVMRGICDCWDPNFTDESENGAWCRKLFLCRLNLIMVPFLAVVDLIVNSLIAFTLLPMIFLCLCYPYRNLVVQRRQEEEPLDGCPLHESCDPMVRVFSSFMLVLATPIIIFGIIKPLPIAQIFVRWADGHTVGYAYFEEACLCFLNPCDTKPVQFAWGVFFRHRGSGDLV